MQAKLQKFSIGYSIAMVLALLLIQAVFFQPHAENLSYSEFKTLARKGKVSNVVLDKQTITGTFPAEGLEGLLPTEKLQALKRAGAGAHAFVTARVDDPGLVAELEAANVKFTGRVENTWVSTLLSWILPALVRGRVGLCHAADGRRPGRPSRDRQEQGQGVCPARDRRDL